MADPFGAFTSATTEALTRPVHDYFARRAELLAKPGPFTGIRLGLLRFALQGEMRNALSRMIGYAAVIGSGGQNLTQAQTAEARRRFDEQARYMENFIRQIDTMTEEAAVRRAASYTAAIIQSITAVQKLDLPVLPTYPGDPHLECKGYCKCHLDIREGAEAGDWDVYWKLGRAEHCPDCLYLAASWNPLKIRAGKIEGTRYIPPEGVEKLQALGLIAYYHEEMRR